MKPSVTMRNFAKRVKKNMEKIVALKRNEGCCQYSYQDNSCCVVGAGLPRDVLRSIRGTRFNLVGIKNLQYSQKCKIAKTDDELLDLARLQNDHDFCARNFSLTHVEVFKMKLNAFLEKYK